MSHHAWINRPLSVFVFFNRKIGSWTIHPSIHLDCNSSMMLLWLFCIICPYPKIVAFIWHPEQKINVVIMFDGCVFVTLRTWWRATWCTLCVRRWRSWRSRSRSWSSVTPSWNRRTPCWRHWPARSRWPSSRPRFRPAPHLPLQLLQHQDPPTLLRSPRPPRTALALRRNPFSKDKLTDFFCFLFFSNFLSVTAEGKHNSKGWRLCSQDKNLHIFISEGCGRQNHRSASQHSRVLKWRSNHRTFAKN